MQKYKKTRITVNIPEPKQEKGELVSNTTQLKSHLIMYKILPHLSVHLI